MAATTAKTAVLLNISEMIDLAVGTPEVGVVDFNMLHTVLHCLAQQLRVLGKNVELRGSVATLPIGRDNVQTIAINEYLIGTDGAPPSKSPARKEVVPQANSADAETILVVERVKKTDSSTLTKSPLRDTSPAHGVPASKAAPASGAAVTTGPSSKSGPATLVAPTPGAPTSASASAPGAPSPEAASVPLAPTSGGAPTPGASPPTSGAHDTPGTVTLPGNTPEKLSLVTFSKFNLLESVVEDLKNRVYGSIPKNEEILEEVRSQTNLKAITDMWTSLNVSSRLEAAETGIAKLSSLIQDLIGASRASAQPGEVKIAEKLSGGETETKSVRGIEDLDALRETLAKLRADVNKLAEGFNMSLSMEEEPQINLPSATSEMPSDRPVSESPRRQSEAPRHQTSAAVPPGSGLMEKIMALEKRLKECCENVNKVDGVVHDTLNSFQDQLEELTKQFGMMHEEMTTGKLPSDVINELENIMALYQTVQGMQTQLKEVYEVSRQFSGEKDIRQQHMDSLVEQIELLKTIKLDREDMIEAMAEKADLQMLARKVSHDQFETVCEDLSRGLEGALGKLGMQEALWQQALDDIQREIEMKLDKMELSPVKEFFSNKLKKLQEHLKQMADLRREPEAAGTKRRLLRDVNCISCDAKAVMAAEAGTSMPVSKPMPASHSMKPYLAYELDTIRKTQASNVPQRNMHDWETIDKQMQPKQPPKVRSETDKHLCNRYCGGSHTVTTAAQRVARLGHFMKQWGPDVVPLSSGLAAGDDGRLYKVSVTEGANVGPGGAVDTVCTPSPLKKNEVKKYPDKPQIIGECGCLEKDRQAKA